MVDIYQHLMNLTLKPPRFFPFKPPIFSQVAPFQPPGPASQPLLSTWCPGWAPIRGAAGHRSAARQLPALAALATQGRHGLQRDAQRGHVVRRRRGRERGPDAAVQPGGTMERNRGTNDGDDDEDEDDD